ncbi:prepilin-type N-terminal cleavage/methylation domain-containing protein [bacterium]|nr:MAG: prepilin-type N-terminal cleavage/methylation domain-containing protein [bacterium]
MQRRNRKAFTLIELLVVIAIIAILAAILFPVFAQAKRAAKKTVDLSNMKQLILGVEMFKADWDGNYPKAWFNDEIGMQMTGIPDPFWGWDYAIMPYVKSKDLYQSPLDGESFKRGLWSTADTDMWQSKLRPDGSCCDRDSLGKVGSRAAEDDIPGSYRYNMSNHPNGPWSALNESSLDMPSEAIIILPSRPGNYPESPGDNNAQHHEVATWDGNIRSRVCVDFVNNVHYDRNNGISGTSNTTTMAQRGQGQANYGFGDGHAKSFNWRQTWKRVGPDQQKGGKTVTPTMWRQNFSGYDDFCNYREGEAPR